MISKKKTLKVFTCLLAVMIFFISCGKKNLPSKRMADNVEEICSEGAKLVQEASTADGVQESYNSTYGKITLLLSESEEKISETDSVRIDIALKSFLEVCCKKAREFDSYLDTDKGLYYMDEEGNVKCGDDEPQGYYLDNPTLLFRAYKPIYETYEVDDETRYRFVGMKVYDADGEVKYSDENAELFYDYYVSHFFFAYLIALKGERIAPYLENNLHAIVCNLPLDDSHPDYVRDLVNKVYYDYIDKLANMRLYKRGYGFVEYAFETFNDFYGGHNIRCFKKYRDDNTGSLSLTTTSHGYNPSNAY